VQSEDVSAESTKEGKYTNIPTLLVENRSQVVGSEREGYTTALPGLGREEHFEPAHVDH